jgi:predicted heme/steroid binding protein
MRDFTRDELRRFDGTNGTPALIAYRGKVYDVSQSFLWQGGRHEAMHTAGADLTGPLAGAPHGDELLKDFPVVGILVEG